MCIATGSRSSTVSFENVRVQLNRTTQSSVRYEYAVCAFRWRDWRQRYANAKSLQKFLQNFGKLLQVFTAFILFYLFLFLLLLTIFCVWLLSVCLSVDLSSGLLRNGWLYLDAIWGGGLGALLFGSYWQCYIQIYVTIALIYAPSACNSC